MASEEGQSICLNDITRAESGDGIEADSSNPEASLLGAVEESPGELKK